MAIYQEVKQDILKQIHDGFYKSGDRIPSERDLCGLYKVSRMTLRQALSELEQEGILVREKGRGTFVTTPNLYQENLRSFTQTLIERGMIPSTIVIEASKVLHLRSISQLLGLDKDEPYYKVKRIRLGDDIPIALETIYIPVKYAKDLKNHNLSTSMYKILEQHYGYELFRNACEIEASLAPRDILDLLDLKKTTALLKVSGITYAQGDLKLFYEESYYRSDLYKYHVDIMGRSK